MGPDINPLLYLTGHENRVERIGVLRKSHVCQKRIVKFVWRRFSANRKIYTTTQTRRGASVC